MKRFAQLFAALDATTKTSVKVGAMARYFAEATPRDAAWAVQILRGERPKRLVNARQLAAWAMESADIAPWLFEESYHAVGDLAETISLLLAAATHRVDRPLHEWIEDDLLPLATADEPAQRTGVRRVWDTIDGLERFLWNKLITGSLRVGVSQGLVVRAVAQASGIDEEIVAHRLAGSWTPVADAYTRLVAGDTGDADVSRPYPFFLAYPLDDTPESLGDVGAWQIEWKWDGIRAQLIRREAQVFLWSRGGEAVRERFPELDAAATRLPDGTVLDGEILAWSGDRPQSFAQLQRRIGRLRPGAKLLADIPVVLMCYDLLEIGGADVRSQPLEWRRAALADLLARQVSTGPSPLRLSPVVTASCWADVVASHGQARENAAEGLMIKALDAPYGVGRRRGPWWKWKTEPYAIDAVMVYAQLGHGRRASLHTDYTFAVWDGDTLVPFAKAYSGLTDDELRQLDGWIRHNTVERFGPVRSVRAEQVFEVGFEGIQRSARHKSGVAVRFPRILRWRTDKRPADADSLGALQALLTAPAAAP